MDSPDDDARAPTMLGHIHLKVRRIEPAIEFYTTVIGLDVTDRYERFAFLSYGDRHHDVALQAIGADTPGPTRGVGLYHAAFEVPTAAALTAVYNRLQERGRQVSPVDHGISKALYFDDPDGNGLEVYLDTRSETDQEEWHGRNEYFDPTALTE